MLQIDESRVRQAAKYWPDAQKVLETLFPEAFSMPICADLKVDCLVKCIATADGRLLVGESIYNDRLYLSTLFNWRIEGNYLIPTKK